MATNVEVEIVKVTHEQLKKRVENLSKAACYDEQTGKTASKFGTEKEEKHPTKSRPSKARKEKEQRKPDQQLYRPGRSRMGRNSSSGGSDLNSSRDQSPSPTKPVQTPAISRDVGSKDDQGPLVQEENLSKESDQHEEEERGAVRSKNRGYDKRSVAEKLHQGEVSGGGGSRSIDKKDTSGNNPAKSGLRPRDKQQLLRQREQQDRPVKQDLSKMPYSDKSYPVDNEHGNEDTWEIKPEDWDSDTKYPTDRGNEAINLAKQMHGRKNRDSHPKHTQVRSRNESPTKIVQGRGANESLPKQLQGRSTNESPPKQVHGRNFRGRHSEDIENKDRKQKVTDDPRISGNRPEEVQGQSTIEDPPKQMHGRNLKGRHSEDIENNDRKQKVTNDPKVSENRPQEVVSLMGNDWDKEFEQQYEAHHSPVAKKSTYLHRRDKTKHTETEERLPRGRSNQTSGSSNRRQDHGARTSDKQGHSKTEPDSAGNEQKKDLVKSSRQNYASEIQKLRAKKEQMEREGFATVPIATTKDLQITVKAGSHTDETSRVVQEKSSKSYSAGRSRQRTNSDNASKNDKTVMDHQLAMSEEWEENIDDLNFHVESMVITNQKFQNKDFEESRFKRFEESRRAPNSDERSQNRDDRDLEYQRDERKRPPNRDDRGLERKRDERARPPNRDDRGFERQYDQRARPPNRDDKFQNRDHHDRGVERQHDERKRPSKNDEKDHAPRQPHTSSSHEQKDHINERPYRDKEKPHVPGNERRFRDKNQSHREDNERRYRETEEPHRSRNERQDDRRSARDEGFDEERRQHDGEPDKRQREQDPRRRYPSGGKKEVTRRRDRVSVSSDDGSERRGRRRGSSEAEESGSKHGGGILRLPGKVDQENSQAVHGSYIPVYDQYYQPPAGQADAPVVPEEPKAKPKGRTGDQSRLWDPSKPHQKPALQQHQTKPGELHFQDPELDKKDSRGGGTPPAGQPENWNSYIPNYPPGFGGGMQPSYGYPPPPPGYPVPNPSWANQVEAAQAYKTGHPPLPPPHMMQYPPPYTGHPYPLPPGMPYPPGFGNPPHAAMLQEHQSLNSQSAQKLLRDAARCETELFNTLSLSIATRDMLQQLLDKQQELEQLYEGIILLDLDLCNQYNVEQTLWKNSYYQIIEGLRKAIQEQPNGESYKEDLLEFMQHGIVFYEGLLNKLQSTYHFQLENRTGLDPLHEEPRRSIKLALLSAQRCMIALGDIARYKEQANETSNYGKARSWYMKAQHLAPRNGRPYNQLAILALYTRRKLDAVYFYVRSLAATNPFLTARESLMTLFEEVRRKVAHKEKEEMEARKEMERRREQRKKRRRRPSRDENRGRTEVWVAQDGKRVGGEKMEDEEEEEEEEMMKGENLSNLSATELNKKFVLSFLNVHGKLFTKTGMEAYDHATEHLLTEFKALLDHSPSAILSTRLIQLMAINMFAVANASPPGESPSTAENRPLLLEQSIQLGLHMFALLCLRCCALLQVHLNQKDTDPSVLSQELHELLPGVKVYADWMMCHPKLWNPPPSYSSTSYSPSLDVWSAVAQFLNLVKRVPVPDVKFAVNDQEDSLEVLLPEDMTLSGFVPLMALPLQPVFIQADTSKILANDRVRLDSLTMFGEYLSGQETPLISFSVKTDSYVSIASKAVPCTETEHSYLQDDELEKGGDDDVIIMDSYMEDEVPHGDGTISRLRERRDSLEKQLRDRELRDAHIQAIVESHRSQRLLEIVIKPYFLIPDTNCFIDHLPVIQRLVRCQRYLMVIPLVVINELDGLARGSREGQFSDPHHAIKVQQGARHAVDYLENEFANRNRYLCALTSKGSTMDNIRFRSEEAEWRGNNDDHILQCCMHYCSDNARQFMPRDKDAPLQIDREVVLLTNDRNLRVKAIQQNVPVKDIIVFVRWAKV